MSTANGPPREGGPQKGVEKSRLDGALDAEFAHAGLEGGALDAKNGGCAVGAGDAPLSLLENLDNVLTLSVVQCAWRRW